MATSGNVVERDIHNVIADEIDSNSEIRKVSIRTLMSRYDEYFRTNHNEDLLLSVMT